MASPDQVFTPYGWPEPGPLYLSPTSFFDFDRPEVADFVDEAAAGATTPRDQAVRLFLAVRDQVRYEAYGMRMTPECFRASTVVRERGAFCIPKAVLLVAGARRLGIPAALGLSDVVNHFSTPRLQQIMGHREVFMHHGWAALHIEGRWVKAVPAFNKELCALMRVPPTDFDGVHDAVLQQYKEDGSVHMEYLRDHGVWSDVPYPRIEDDWRGYYPSSLWDGERDPLDVKGL
ncbi:transglutaminase-like domain-containing protein [Hydrogenophaga sp.]|jgi:transglutaminase-like putative cysteine protease|uniref:transglutaminase-like domain-containing protein n=1 Tax=Hydrogenophaga sp. TaxID=1904254 RepID=UPI003F718603